MNENDKKGKVAESAVEEIATKSYLKYWCYPSPKDVQGNKKEICDLLILFKKSAIIISIKNYKFKGNYQQYFKDTLEKAVAQIQGAERKLFNNTANVHINHPYLEEEIFKPEQYTYVYRIIINVNNSPLFYPGGLTTSKQKFIHVFNFDAFKQVVEELNTIPDFVNYLQVREKTFGSKNLLMTIGEDKDWNESITVQLKDYISYLWSAVREIVLISGTELDLLANFYFNEKLFSDDITKNNSDINAVFLTNEWIRYTHKKEVIDKKSEEKYSYFVDELVKQEILYKNDKHNIALATVLLSLSRFDRRILGKQFYRYLKEIAERGEDVVGRSYVVIDNIAFGFLIYPDYIKRNEVSPLILLTKDAFNYWNGYKHNSIVIIGINSKASGIIYGYEDDVVAASPDEEKKLLKTLDEFGWLKDVQQVHEQISEYPNQ